MTNLPATGVQAENISKVYINGVSHTIKIVSILSHDGLPNGISGAFSFQDVKDDSATYLATRVPFGEWTFAGHDIKFLEQA